MTEQWKNVTAYELASKHLAHTAKIVYNDGSAVSGPLLGVSQRLRESGNTFDLVTVATISIAGNDERFDLLDAKGISVLEDDTES